MYTEDQSVIIINELKIIRINVQSYTIYNPASIIRDSYEINPVTSKPHLHTSVDWSHNYKHPQSIEEPINYRNQGYSQAVRKITRLLVTWSLSANQPGGTHTQFGV